MIKAKTTLSLLLAGLMAGGAWAQTASATSDVPLKAGEASTQTRGQPNMATANQPTAAAPVTSATGVPVDSATVPSTATMGAPREVPLHRATVTSNTPTMAGEASTTTNGVPNMSTNNPVTDGSRILVAPEQRVQHVPQQAGEASTMVGGRPNVDPNDPIYHR